MVLLVALLRFSHLRILDNVMDLLLRDDARQLHEACAKALEGTVDVVQLAQHNEQARGHRLLPLSTPALARRWLAPVASGRGKGGRGRREAKGDAEAD